MNRLIFNKRLLCFVSDVLTKGRITKSTLSDALTNMIAHAWFEMENASLKNIYEIVQLSKLNCAMNVAIQYAFISPTSMGKERTRISWSPFMSWISLMISLEIFVRNAHKASK